MNRNLKILITIGIILVIAFGGFKINKTIAANKQLQEQKQIVESNYENVVNSIKDENLTEAKNGLENLSGYKDADALLQYVLALEESKKPESSHFHINSFLDKIPLDYTGDCKDEIIELRERSKITAEDLLKQKEENLTELIKKGDYELATLNSSADFPVLFNYANALKEENKGNHPISLYYLSNIPKDYTGAMSSEIMALINANSSDIQKEKARVSSLPPVSASTSNKSYTFTPTPKPPKIGMTAKEVLDSDWGSPRDKNRTTTAYGVDEQWVYGNGKYIYLEDGVVTAIQD